MFSRREVMYIFLGLTIGALVGSAQKEVPAKFQQCVTSCTDARGYVLDDGNYPYCDQCNDFVQCVFGNMDIQHCPLGTNYFNRKLGVCDSDIRVCVNDTLITTTTTTTKRPVPNSQGYTPRSGGEADSFWFAIDLYNKNSLETMRAGVQTVDSLTAENGPDVTFYRIYGATLVQTTCPNKPEFTKADYTKCPLMTPAPGNNNQYFVAKCDFKVQFTPSKTEAAKLDMVYMMCNRRI